MKPLLIIPPDRERTAALETLLDRCHAPQHERDDLLARMVGESAGNGDDSGSVMTPRESQSALAVLPDGGVLRGVAALARRADQAVLLHCSVDPEFRRRGIARQLLEVLLGWFDMTGGNYVYANLEARYADWFAHLRFTQLHRVALADSDRVALWRRRDERQTTPVPDGFGQVSLEPLNGSHLPDLVALLMHRQGPDPRIAGADSAVAAIEAAIRLSNEVRAGRAGGVIATQFHRVAAVGTYAADPAGKHAIGQLIPAEGTHPSLRRALRELAKEAGYSRLDFPYDAYLPRRPKPKDAKRNDLKRNDSKRNESRQVDSKREQAEANAARESADDAAGKPPANEQSTASPPAASND